MHTSIAHKNVTNPSLKLKLTRSDKAGIPASWVIRGASSSAIQHLSCEVNPLGTTMKCMNTFLIVNVNIFLLSYGKHCMVVKNPEKRIIIVSVSIDVFLKFRCSI